MSQSSWRDFAYRENDWQSTFTFVPLVLLNVKGYLVEYLASQPVQGTAEGTKQIWSLTAGGLLTKVNYNGCIYRLFFSGTVEPVLKTTCAKRPPL